LNSNFSPKNNPAVVCLDAERADRIVYWLSQKFSQIVARLFPAYFGEYQIGYTV
jgi:hypothetical protein